MKITITKRQEEHGQREGLHEYEITVSDYSKYSTPQRLKGLTINEIIQLKDYLEGYTESETN